MTNPIRSSVLFVHIDQNVHGVYSVDMKLSNTQQKIINALKQGEILSVNASSKRGSFNHEAWLGSVRVSVSTVNALENKGFIKPLRKDWIGGTFVLA